MVEKVEGRARALGALLLRQLGRGLDLLLPPRCLGCGQVVEQQARLCAPCWRGLTFLGPPLCRCCGYPLAHAAAAAPLCAACATHPPAFERARAALRYDAGSRGMILRFKHGDRTDAAPVLATWLVRVGDELLAEAELIAPVPLHRWRLLKRGYNQAALLGHAVAKATGIRQIPDLLQRVRATPSQQGLGGQERLQNVTSSAFRVPPRWQPALAGRRVLLLDDVLTTGATIAACANVLLAAGAGAVDVLCLARVVRDGHDALSVDALAAAEGGPATAEPAMAGPV